MVAVLAPLSTRRVLDTHNEYPHRKPARNGLRTVGQSYTCFIQSEQSP